MIHTYSANGTFSTCKRLYRYKSVDLIRPAIQGKALLMGTAHHEGCEVFDRGGSLVQALDAMRKTHTDPFWDTDKGKIEEARNAAMMAAYFTTWAPDREQWETVAVESEFMIELAPGIMAAGKIDSLWRHIPSKRLYLVERKTTSDDIDNVGRDYWQLRALDKQTTLYKEVVEREYGEPVRILYDVVKKPTGNPVMKKRSRQGKDETDEAWATRKASLTESLGEFTARLVEKMIDESDRYLVRHEIHRTRDQQAEILAEFIETANEIEHYTGTYPRNDKACGAYFGTCAYLGVCAGTESLDSDRFEKLETAHPELSGTQKGTA